MSEQMSEVPKVVVEWLNGAMKGHEEEWWKAPTELLDGQSPSQMWDSDRQIRLRSYIVSALSGDAA